MNYLDQIAERIASGPDVGLVEMLTTGVFVAAVFGSVFFALAVVLMAACCWQTLAEARECDRMKNRLRLDAASPTAVVAPAVVARMPDGERSARVRAPARSWTVNVRQWTFEVSIDRIEKPA
jgi:hypothetical protein